MPAFAVAAGLVTDAGGPLSHSSIIVREFGIPAVMGVQTATQTIVDGQLITLDGGEGVVQLLE
jgi:pyruvate,water dikinase